MCNYFLSGMLIEIELSLAYFLSDCSLILYTFLYRKVYYMNLLSFSIVAYISFNSSDIYILYLLRWNLTLIFDGL